MLCTPQANYNFPDFSRTSVKFPDFSRLSRWVATMPTAPALGNWYLPSPKGKGHSRYPVVLRGTTCATVSTVEKYRGTR